MPVGLCFKIHHGRAKMIFEINYICFFLPHPQNHPQTNCSGVDMLHSTGKAPGTHSSQHRLSLCPFWSWSWAAPTQGVDGQGHSCWPPSAPLPAGSCSWSCSPTVSSQSSLPWQAWTMHITLRNTGQEGSELTDSSHGTVCLDHSPHSWELHDKVNCQPDWTAPIGHEISTSRWSQVSPKPCKTTAGITLLHCAQYFSIDHQRMLSCKLVMQRAHLNQTPISQNQWTGKLRNIIN